MDKRELIGFILNDIKELELIVKGMYELEKIPDVMQELAISKTQNIQDRFSRLKVKENPQPEIQPPVENLPETTAILPEETKVREEPETEQEEAVELIEEEQEIIFYQEMEPEEKPQEDSEVPEPGNPKSEILELIQPEEKKGTFFAEVKVQVQERTTTNEKFKSRVHSATATSLKRVESRFIQNLRKAINLNDRYRYQKELFGGNAELMNSVIDRLDAMSSLEEATDYVQKEFIWNMDSQTVTDFYSLLESRFS
ncbi:MAG: hypothetical protein LBR52_00815 [Prevotellaceae bacterium]|jgi:hypothetical protein|nr:hypothetical protein [Prevotellaceae bacterium]